ncbi:hypothetical protein EO087_01735 [Dyella sp. M7H15-1]|uniref:OB-fold protein n=1 Tax=Dyella sp. M7H15-1 TaxID=2501295 RepID=UPI0010051CA1|nr:hypothetical protein [Dyella sp. M7H15-1]QAU22864.1 hypothetical protein EO087_01735 [Dyella sp. M7H15-1]
MRDVLAFVCILSAVGSIAAALIGVIRPSVFAKKGAPPPGRLRLLGAGVSAFVGFSILGGFFIETTEKAQSAGPLPSQTPTSQSLQAQGASHASDTSTQKPAVPAYRPNAEALAFLQDVIRQDINQYVAGKKSRIDWSELSSIRAFTSAGDLLAEYHTNEVAADNNYMGQRIAIAGRIATVSKSVSGTPFVAMIAGNGAVGNGVIRADLSPITAAQAEMLKRGGTATLACIVAGMNKEMLGNELPEYLHVGECQSMDWIASGVQEKADKAIERWFKWGGHLGIDYYPTSFLGRSDVNDAALMRDAYVIPAVLGVPGSCSDGATPSCLSAWLQQVKLVAKVSAEKKDQLRSEAKVVADWLQLPELPDAMDAVLAGQS